MAARISESCFLPQYWKQWKVSRLELLRCTSIPSYTINSKLADNCFRPPDLITIILHSTSEKTARRGNP